MFELSNMDTPARFSGTTFSTVPGVERFVSTKHAPTSSDAVNAVQRMLRNERIDFPGYRDVTVNYITRPTTRKRATAETYPLLPGQINVIPLYADADVRCSAYAIDVEISHEQYQFLAKELRRSLDSEQNILLNRFEGLLDENFPSHELIGLSRLSLSEWEFDCETVVEESSTTRQAFKVSAAEGTPDSVLLELGSALNIAFSSADKALKSAQNLLDALGGRYPLDLDITAGLMVDDKWYPALARVRAMPTRARTVLTVEVEKVDLSARQGGWLVHYPTNS